MPGLGKALPEDQSHRRADAHLFVVTVHAEHRIEIDHRVEMNAQLRVDLPPIRPEAEAHLDELFRLQQLDQKRQANRPVDLKQIGLVVQRKLNHVRALTDIARDKCRLGFGVESDDAGRLDLFSGCSKLFRACRHMDALQREADKRFHQRDLIPGRGNFVHVRSSPQIDGGLWF